MLNSKLLNIVKACQYELNSLEKFYDVNFFYEEFYEQIQWFIDCNYGFIWEEYIYPAPRISGITNFELSDFYEDLEYRKFQIAIFFEVLSIIKGLENDI